MKPKPTVEKFRTPDGTKWVSITRPSKTGGEIAEAFPVEDK